jgi:hypothetical protein
VALVGAAPPALGPGAVVPPGQDLPMDWSPMDWSLTGPQLVAG